MTSKQILEATQRQVLTIKQIAVLLDRSKKEAKYFITHLKRQTSNLYECDMPSGLPGHTVTSYGMRAP